MERLVYDIETDEIRDGNVEKIHCVVLMDMDTMEVDAYHDVLGLKPWTGSLLVGLQRLADADVVAGHNIEGFDEDACESIYPINFRPKENRVKIDTLSLSRILFPARFEHSLESWAKDLKTPQQKIQNDDWSKLTQVVLDRCVSDVKINLQLLKYFNRVTSKHQLEGTNWLPALFTEQAVSRIHTKQVKHGVWYDVKQAKINMAKLDVMMAEASEYIIKAAPKRLEVPSLNEPALERLRGSATNFHPGQQPFMKIKEFKRPFKPDGTLTVNAEKVFENSDQGKYVAGPFTDIHANWNSQTISWFGEGIGKVRGQYSKITFEPLNINSDTQVKDFLKKLGWKPDEWNTKKQPDGTFLKTSPKLSESSFGSLPPGIGKDIQRYRQMKHRRGLIQSIKDPSKGALAKVRPDGRVGAEAITCGTPTARYTHSGAVCNIPRPSSNYGELIRVLYGVHPDNWQVGIDLSGIEARMLAHFCYKYHGGPQFAELVTEGDWHTENSVLWHCTRDDAKTELYALMYNAGPLKLGNILGQPASVGKKNKQRFMEAYTPYAELVEELEAELRRNNGYIVGLDGRRFYVRNKKDVLNTCLQGNSAIVFKNWMVRLQKLRAKYKTRIEQMIAYHDETQNEVYSPSRLIAVGFGEDACHAAAEVGKSFNLNVPIKAEAKVGKNWLECH